MKTRILTNIITGVLATSIAQADSAFSTRDLDVIYSGLNPSFTRDVDVSSYYTVPAQLQQTTANKPICNWRMVKNNLNAPKYTVAGNTEYFAPTNLQLMC